MIKQEQWDTLLEHFRELVRNTNTDMFNIEGTVLILNFLSSPASSESVNFLLKKSFDALTYYMVAHCGSDLQFDPKKVVNHIDEQAAIFGHITSLLREIEQPFLAACKVYQGFQPPIEAQLEYNSYILVSRLFGHLERDERLLAILANVVSIREFYKAEREMESTKSPSAAVALHFANNSSWRERVTTQASLPRER